MGEEGYTPNCNVYTLIRKTDWGTEKIYLLISVDHPQAVEIHIAVDGLKTERVITKDVARNIWLNAVNLDGFKPSENVWRKWHSQFESYEDLTRRRSTRSPFYPSLQSMKEMIEKFEVNKHNDGNGTDYALKA